MANAKEVQNQHGDEPTAEEIKLTKNHQQAHMSNHEEHQTGIFQSFVRYPGACIWCITLLSFDVQAAGAVVGMPEFRKDFGYEYEGGYVLPAKWQSAFGELLLPFRRAIISCLIAAKATDMFGRKKTLMGALVISYIAVAVEFVATSNAVFFTGKFLNGFMVGTVAAVMITYIGEIAPLALRGIFTCCIGVAYGLGPLVAFIVIRYTGHLESRWAYRAVFCAQFGFAGIATVFVPFMPESPWWQASKGQNEAALRSRKQLSLTSDEGKRRLALIELTLEEVRAETDSVTYLECFRKSNFRRTIIAIMPYCIQSFSGISFLAQPVVSIVGNLVAAATVDYVGRRNLTFYGLIILTVFLLITGGLAVKDSPAEIRGTVAFILIYSWWYNASIGSTAFSLLSEVATSRLRVKTVAIGYAVHSGINVMWQFVIPFMFNPDKGNLGGKIAFIFGGMCFFCLLYLWLWQPETTGRSFQELDEMFAKGIPARKFKSYNTGVQMNNEAAAASRNAMIEVWSQLRPHHAVV
ncbi:major facilitator superfamily domain-containing protein [Aspergillus heterothallicus]